MVAFIKRATNTAFAFCMLCANSVFAQVNKIYSLAELVDSSRHCFPSLLQKEALINSAKASVIDAKHAFLPRLSIGDEIIAASANSLPGAYPGLITFPSVSGSINAANNNAIASGNIAALYAEYELSNFGLKNARTGNAIAYEGMQQADFDRELYLVKWEIGRLYFDLFKNTFQLGIEQRNINRYDSIYSVIKALTGSGINAGVDSSLAKAELSKAKISYNDRLGIVLQLQQQLAYYTGITSGINIDTTEKKYVADNILVHANDSAINPITAYFDRQELLFKSNELLIKKSYLPKLLLAATGWGRGSSINYNNEYKGLETGLGYQRFNFAFGISISYDLLNGVRKKDKLSVAHYQLQAAGFETKKQVLAMKTALLQADEAVKVAEKDLEELPIQVAASSEAFEQKIAQYKAGIINLVDLTNTSFILYSAQLTYAQTLNQWLIANLNKAAISGNLDYFIQSLKQ